MSLCTAGCFPQAKLSNLDTLPSPGSPQSDHIVAKPSADTGSLRSDLTRVTVDLKMPIGSMSHIHICPNGPAGGVAEQSCALTKYDTACHEMLLGKIFYILPSNSLDLLLIKKVIHTTLFLVLEEVI